jgi:predicted nucleic acid-binding protein
MTRLIVDTSALYALADRCDTNHFRATIFLKEYQVSGGMLMSNHVFDEIMTLSKVRLGVQVACQMGLRLRQSRFVEMVVFSMEEEQETWRVFNRYRDKDWSYTDCACLVLAQRNDIKEAFTFDHHFAQMGLVVRP